jgi:hypothetical protein
MELKKELARAFAHYENFIRVVIKDEQQLDVYLNATKTWSEEEMLFMREYWDIDNNGGCPCDDCDEYTCNSDICECDVEVVLDNMTKLELEAYTLDEHGVDLDRRLNKDKLIKQINELEDKD